MKLLPVLLVFFVFFSLGFAGFTDTHEVTSDESNTYISVNGTDTSSISIGIGPIKCDKNGLCRRPPPPPIEDVGMSVSETDWYSTDIIPIDQNTYKIAHTLSKQPDDGNTIVSYVFRYPGTILVGGEETNYDMESAIPLMQECHVDNETNESICEDLAYNENGWVQDESDGAFVKASLDTYYIEFNDGSVFDFNDIANTVHVWFNEVRLTSGTVEVRFATNPNDWMYPIVIDPTFGNGTIQNCVANAYDYCNITSSSTIVTRGTYNLTNLGTNISKGAVITLNASKLFINSTEYVNVYGMIDGSGRNATSSTGGNGGTGGSRCGVAGYGNPYSAKGANDGDNGNGLSGKGSGTLVSPFNFTSGSAGVYTAIGHTVGGGGFYATGACYVTSSTYGSSANGGGSGSSVRIYTNQLFINGSGSILAGGGTGYGGATGGGTYEVGGSGGGEVTLFANTINNTGTISVKGSAARSNYYDAEGGDGGRVRMCAVTSNVSGTVTLTGGAGVGGPTGATGTATYVKSASCYTVPPAPPTSLTIALDYPLDNLSALSPVNFAWNAIGTSAAYECNLTIDGALNQTGMAVLNGTSANHSLTMAVGPHSWNVSCANGTLSNVSATYTFNVPVATNITDCTNITSSEWYAFANNLTGTQSGGYCLNISVSDVGIDCSFNSMDGNGSGIAIYIGDNVSNITIQNCLINDYEIGIESNQTEANSVNDIHIISNSFDGVGGSINLYNSTDVDANYNIMSNITTIYTAITITSYANTTVNILHNNFVDIGQTTPIDVTTDNYQTEFMTLNMSYNDFTNTTGIGRVENMVNSVIAYNTFVSGGEIDSSILYQDNFADNLSIIGNNISANTSPASQYLIDLSQINNSIVSGNILESNATGAGINVANAYTSIFDGNTITVDSTGDDYGIYFSDDEIDTTVSNNVMVVNVIGSGLSTGLYYAGANTNNISIDGNTITALSSGIYFNEVATNVNISNNNMSITDTNISGNDMGHVEFADNAANVNVSGNRFTRVPHTNTGYTDVSFDTNNNTNVTITNNYFEHNTEGGAVYVEGANIIFSNNNATNTGSYIFALYVSGASIIDNNFIYNIDSAFAGFNTGVTPGTAITNLRIENATFYYAPFFVGGNATTITNSILYNVTAPVLIREQTDAQRSPFAINVTNFTVGYNSSLDIVMFDNFMLVNGSPAPNQTHYYLIENTHYAMGPDFFSINDSNPAMANVTLANATLQLTTDPSCLNHTIYKLAGFPTTYDDIIANGTPIGSADACSNGVATFNVTGFSGYAIGPSPSVYIIFTSPTPANNTNLTSSPAVFNITTTDPFVLIDSGYTEINGTNISCTVAADNKSCSYPLVLAASAYNVTGYAGIGGTYYQVNETREYVGDFTFPFVMIDFPANSTYATPALDLNYTVIEDNLEECWYSVNGGATVITNCLNTSILGQEDYNNVTVYANDTSGHESSNTTYFTVNTPLPIVIIDFPANATYGSPALDLNYSVTDDDIDSCWHSLNGAANVSTGCLNTTIAGQEDFNSVVVWANDSAGHEVSNATYFTVDTTPPSLSLFSPGNITYGAGPVDLKYTTSDLHPDACWYTLNGGSPTSLPGCANATITGTEGSNLLWLYANDTMGNMNMASDFFTVDTTAPALTIDFPDNSTYATHALDLNITAADDNLDSCWYSLNGGINTSIPGCAHTTITAAEINNEVAVYANDTLGNENSSILYFTTDTTAPTISYIAYTDTGGTHKTGVYPTVWVAYNVQAIDSVSGLDHITGVTSLNGGLFNTYTVLTSPATKNMSNLLDGNYRFNATACDNMGNCNTLPARTVTVSIYGVGGPYVTLLNPGYNEQFSIGNVSFVCGGINPITAKVYVDGMLADTTTCSSGVPCSADFGTPGDCRNAVWNVSCTDIGGKHVSEARPVTIVPDYSNVTPDNGITITNTTSLTFSIQPTCTPASDPKMQFYSYPTNYTMACLFGNCSYVNTTWNSGYHTWFIITPLTTGGAVHSPTFNLMVPFNNFNITSNLSFAKNYTYLEFTTYTTGFFEDYGPYFLSILAYALAWLITQRYPQTLIAGGIGSFFIYLVTGNIPCLVMSVLTVVGGLCYKIVVG